ncbi:uncharacterized protein LOC124831936 [Vigna umbellata]|uniref:uncharacterized protein LOC124831936 n=1 Tax=Vigna umbellata TaxID=87088 RepID=UPI001F5E5ABE|nr:uncharacterized protein LOC124831936 [Vigna umbellata]
MRRKIRKMVATKQDARFVRFSCFAMALREEVSKGCDEDDECNKSKHNKTKHNKSHEHMECVKKFAACEEVVVGDSFSIPKAISHGFFTRHESTSEKPNTNAYMQETHGDMQ